MVSTDTQTEGDINILFTHSSLSKSSERKSVKIISWRKFVPKSVIAVCPETRTKHVNNLYGQKVEFLNVKSRGSKCNHGVLRMK